jgi:DNA-binding protein H-NS
MAIDLSRMTDLQLAQLIEQAHARRLVLQGEKIAKVRDKVLAMITSEGVDYGELMGHITGKGSKAAKKRAKVKPKYRNPADKNQTWSGRGRHPLWFDAAIKAGKKEASLLIK